MTVEFLDFQICCVDKPTGEGKPKAHHEHEHVESYTGTVETLLCVTRGHLDEQIADEKEGHDAHDDIALILPVMEPDERSCEGQAEDHDPDAHQVNLEQQVIVLAAQRLESVIHGARSHANEDRDATRKLDPERLRLLVLSVASGTADEKHELEEDIEGWDHVRIDVTSLVVHLT